MDTYQLPLFAIHEAAPAYGAEAASVAVSAIDKAIVPQLYEAIQRVHSEFVARLTPAMAERLGKRVQRGLEIALQLDQVLETEDPDAFKVRSSSTRGNYYYNVTIGAVKTCTCPDFEHTNGQPCKHILAAYFTSKAIAGLGEIAQPEAPAAQEPAPAYPPAARPKNQTCPPVEAGQLFDEKIVYGELQCTDASIMVEISAIGSGLYLVRALPVLDPLTGVMTPYFPFASPYDGTPECFSSAIVPARYVSNLRVYHQGKDCGRYENLPALPEIPLGQ